jgi:hypothetical protein
MKLTFHARFNAAQLERRHDLARVDQRNPMLLGGNQGDTVSLRRYPRSRVLDYRWPIGFKTP